MESTLNLENIKGIYQENCFVYHIQNYFSSYVYLKDIYIYIKLWKEFEKSNLYPS